MTRCAVLDFPAWPGQIAATAAATSPLPRGWFAVVAARPLLAARPFWRLEYV